jgi:uncharacterized protein YegP (UPF0339 family)
MIQFRLLPSKSATQPFFWDVISDGNNKILAASETYVRRQSAIDTVLLIKANAHNPGVIKFEVVSSNVSAQPWRWRIVAVRNSSILAHSETYVNYQDAAYAMKLVQDNAANAPFLDYAKAA